MARFFYSLLLYVLAPLVWLLLARRARRAGGRWQVMGGERFGRYGDRVLPQGAVWMHAVSLGETRAAEPLVRALLLAGQTVVLTHMTATGRAEGARLFAQAIDHGQLVQLWQPYDFPGATRRFMQALRPRCGVLMEREIWPNLLAAAEQARVPMVMVSARFSASSLRQALRFRALLGPALASLDAVLAQTEMDAQRLREAGAQQISVMGNLKFDMSLPEPLLAAGHAWRRALGRPVVLLASARDGEEQMLVDAVKVSMPSSGAVMPVMQPADAQIAVVPSAEGAAQTPLWLVVPRHPQRFDAAADILAGLDGALLRRSTLGTLERMAEGHEDDMRALRNATVLLGDSLGEMPFYYAAADVVLMGGSFAPMGGQNVIEACAAGAPAVVGPNTWNFEQAVVDGCAAGAIEQVSDLPLALAVARAWIEQSSERARRAAAAREWVAAHRGATERALTVLAAYF